MRLKNDFKNTIVIERSEFITYLHKTFQEDDAKDFIQSIRKQHHDATHVCTAFVIGEHNEIQRSNDDGEPSGTAGSPMLQCLILSQMHDTVACVVRYFGGIKLGAGGLIRAYSSSVSKAIELAPKVETVLMEQYEIHFPYDMIGKMDYLLKDCATITNKEYELDVLYAFFSNDPHIEEKIQELGNGKYPLLSLGKTIVEVDLKEDTNA